MADEPMSDERLAEIMSLSAEVAAGSIQVRFDEETAWFAILDLRREVERLRAKEAAIYALVNNVISAIQDARNLARSQHWNQAVDDALIRAINEARYIQEDEPHVS